MFCKKHHDQINQSDGIVDSKYLICNSKTAQLWIRESNTLQTFESKNAYDARKTRDHISRVGPKRE